MSKKYTNPPVVEVVCEFTFKVNDPNDLTVPGRLYERFSEKYPLKEEIQQVVFSFDLKMKEVKSKFGEPVPGMQFRSGDGKDLLRVSPSAVAVHRLTPYSTWDDFAPRAKSAFDAFQEVVHPNGLERLALRYIDRVEIPSLAFALGDYIRVYPEVPMPGFGPIARFFVHVQIPRSQGRDALVLAVHNPPGSPDGKSWIVLDWTYALAVPGAVEMDHALDWLEEAHTGIVEAFEEAITDKCRDLFGSQE